MARDKKNKSKQGTPRSRKNPGWLLLVGIILLGGAAAALLFRGKSTSSDSSQATNAVAMVAAKTPAAAASTNVAATPAGTNALTPALPSMEINQAVMVTQELDFGKPVPTIAEALQSIERRHQPEDGVGRTFAILDAYGEPTPEGKLHISMHVSTEKPGVGSIVFRRTGEVLWSSRITALTNGTKPAFTGKSLTILVNDGMGRTFTVDGSSNPTSILDATLKEPGVPVTAVWPDGEEREVTFIYSACGCPVKVLARRQGDRTVRTKELPVIFPDDPDAVRVITSLMRW
jgi:hypothetical protein